MGNLQEKETARTTVILQYAGMNVTYDDIVQNAKNKYQFDWLCTPSVGTELLKGKIALGLSATFSVTNYGDNAVADSILNFDRDNPKKSTNYTKEQINTTFATFNNLNFSSSSFF